MEVAVGNGHGFHHVGVFLFHYAPQTVEVVIKAVVITRSPVFFKIQLRPIKLPEPHDVPFQLTRQ